MGTTPSQDAGWVPAFGASAERVEHRGLTNPAGSNTCFLNCCLQALWHLGSFRAALAAGPPHNHHAAVNACMTCALRDLFTYYRFSEDDAIPPDEARRTLALIDAVAFPLGAMADAAETLERILACLHAEACTVQAQLRGAAAAAGDACEAAACSPPCAAHASFAYSFLAWLRCARCGARTEPCVESAVVYPVYVAELAAVLATAAEHGGQVPRGSAGACAPAPPRGSPPVLGAVLSAIAAAEARTALRASLAAGGAAAVAANPHVPGAAGRGRDGPPRCGSGTGALEPERICLDLPPVFCVSLRWPAAETPKQLVRGVLALVCQVLDFRLLFALDMENDDDEGGVGGRGVARGAPPAGHLYRLRGLVLYYGRHYVAAVASELQKTWLLLDDQRVTPIGDWAAVVDKCVASRYQPTMLFYEQLGHGSAAGDGNASGGPAIAADTSLPAAFPSGLGALAAEAAESHHGGHAAAAGVRGPYSSGELPSPGWHASAAYQPLVPPVAVPVAPPQPRADASISMLRERGSDVAMLPSVTGRGSGGNARRG